MFKKVVSVSVLALIINVDSSLIQAATTFNPLDEEISVTNSNGERVKRDNRHEVDGYWVWSTEFINFGQKKRAFSNYKNYYRTHGARVSIGKRSSGWVTAKAKHWAKATVVGAPLARVLHEKR